MRNLVYLIIVMQIVGSLAEAVENLGNITAFQTVANDGLEFSKRFYKATIKDVPGNFISSPVSASSALSMLAYGARGQTQAALKTELHFDEDDNFQKNGLKTLVEQLNKSPGVELKLASKIFLANSVAIKSDYEQLVEEVFKSSIQNVDFSKAAEASKLINTWSEKETNSRIKRVISSDSLNADTLAVLVNAVYFQGKWTTPFKKDVTRDDLFYLEDGSTRNISTMYSRRRCNFGFLDDFNATFAELPYEGDQVSMFIILPDEITGLKNLQENFAQMNISYLLAVGRKVPISLSLPKFEIETEIDLRKPITALGMGSIFDKSADFSGIFNKPAKIDKAMQKAYIKVDEEGTEAAAVTVHRAVIKSGSKRYQFFANRPFYYAIVKRMEGLQGIVLFQGHYKGL